MIDYNEKIDIDSEEEFNDFIDEIFEDCVINEYFIDGGSFEFKLVNGIIPIEIVWIKIKKDLSVENYQNILKAIKYINNNTNIEVSIIDLNIQ